MSRQLALKVGLPDLASFDNFHPGRNREAAAAVRELAGRRPGVLFLHGASGTGKSHLLLAAVKEAELPGRAAQYVSRNASDPETGSWLELPGDGLVCIDDIGDSVTPAEAAAMFSLYERVQGQSGSLLLSSRLAPSAVSWVLPDLASRVQSDLVYRLAPFTEGDLESALRLRAAKRGLELSDEVVRFVLRRYERTPASLFRLLDRIDVESLAWKRKVTIPFLKELESELTGGGSDQSARP